MFPAWFALSVAVAVPPVTAPAADGFVVLADDWARPRSGESVVALPSLREAVHAWLAADGASLVVVHPGGERGTLWGGEVRDWLVALGVAPSRIVLQPGGPRDDAVILRVEGQ